MKPPKRFGSVITDDSDSPISPLFQLSSFQVSFLSALDARPSTLDSLRLQISAFFLSALDALQTSSFRFHPSAFSPLIPMRIPPSTVSCINNAVQTLAPESELLLFGSRTNDVAKGGDIDILAG